MRDPKLEEEIALVKRCMEMLKRFHEIFDNAIVSETLIPEDETRIEQLAKTLPEEWDSLFRQLGLRHDDSVESVAGMASSLSAVIALNNFQRRKLYDLWHKAYMKLHFLLGKLEYRQEKLEAFGRGRRKVKTLLRGPAIVIVVGLVVLILYIVLKRT